MRKIGLALAALALASCGTSTTEGDSEPDAPDLSEKVGDDIGAYVICKQFVEDRLVAPKTADFGAYEATRVRGAIWQVNGTVDSENRFGVPLSNDYGCQVRFLGEDRWRLQDMTGLTN